MIRSSTSHYCGRDLSSALSLVCQGWYKRSDPGIFKINEIEPEDMEVVTERLFPLFMDPQLALAMVGQGGRYKRHGIVDECCHNPCTVNELRNYCGSAEY
ncbi:bombyxin A-1 homolog isoform X2 [Macrosteles quadrilineatus]|uniref:bombyxin A-1 homolog isoform X2 n=1 Tax=Macrosteles quadrilineatus TaxID=74068 RepID=UPI0023E0F813|nr:bombyxin A-1 homolog isoform X2 [Macrosteles quadrilineatus]